MVDGKGGHVRSSQVSIHNESRHTVGTMRDERAMI